MPFFRDTAERLAALLRRDRNLPYRASVDSRIAPYVMSLFDKLAADDEDSETYRTALVAWHRSERPPLALYDGDTSFCRIDGPLEWAGTHALPLGGLVLTPGVTAHLDPFEAGELHDHMKSAIERAIRAWVVDHGLSIRPLASIKFDRRDADREAKAMIADWAARHDRDRTVSDSDVEGSDHV